MLSPDKETIESPESNGSGQFFTNPMFEAEEEIQSTPNEINNNNNSSNDVNQIITDFKPTTLSWNNLNVYSKGSSGLISCLTKPKEPFHIIKNVSGQARPGNLLAILGASGAGKTTLLNVLTGQNLNKLNIQGQVSLNNEPTTIEKLSLCSSYVQQDDLFFGVLTVREHLKFQLKLRAVKPLKSDEINLIIDRLLIKLGLMKVSNSRIKCESTGQRLSGGELKRLSVATQILTEPAILFCDEPTSGLDSFMAQSVISVLKSLANEQRTIVCTIHQPSSEIFKMFDKIMLLAEGRLAFLGNSNEALNFFSQLGLNCPSNYNPPDFFIQQLSIAPGNVDETRSKLNMICDKYEESEHHSNLQSQISNEIIKDQNDFSKSTKSRGVGILSQFGLLVWRATLINLRDPMLTTSRIVNTVFSALLVALVYWRQNYNQEGIQNINGAIFLQIVNQNFSSIFIVIGAFSIETPIFLREHANGLYRVSVYYLARMFSDLPYFIILPVLTWSSCYYAINLYNDFDTFLIGNVVCILVVNAASGFGYFVSSVSTTLTVGLELAPPLMAPLVLLGGTFLNSATIPGWIAWIKYFSWFFYANEILTIYQWRDVTSIDCDYETPVSDAIAGVLSLKDNGTIPTGQGCLINGKQVIASVGFKESNVNFDYLMLFFTIVVFRILAYIALRVRAKLKR